MFEQRRLRKAAEEARRQEFLAGVGGIELLQHALMPRLQDGLFGSLGSEVPRKILQDHAKRLAEGTREGWIAAGAETEGRTPQEFVDERLAEFLAVTEGSSLLAVTRWAEKRSKPG